MWKEYLSEDEIDNILKRTTIDILPKEEFIKVYNKRGTLGVNFGGDNIYVLSSSSLKYGSRNSLRQTFLHEFTHSVNFDGVTSGYDNSYGKALNEVLTEHFAGVFPLWLAPVQVKVMNISDNSLGYAKEIENKLLENGIKAELDARNEKIGYKIREAQLQKIPYMIIVGDNEVETKTISVRGRGNENVSGLKLDSFIQRLTEEIKLKKR